MKYTALKLSATKEYNPTKSGFETEDLAWDYIAEHRCDICRAEEGTDDPMFACDGEWMVITDEE